MRATGLGRILLLFLLGAIVGCGRPAATMVAGTGETAGVKLRVVTSTAILADFIARVGGARIEVVALIPAGADPHAFEPAPQDARRIAEADLIVVNGLGLEEGVAGILEANRRDGVPIVVLAEGLESEQDEDAAGTAGPPEAEATAAETEAHDHEDGDPHLWLDARNVIAYVERIRDALVAADPGGADAYRSAASAYLAELRELDGWIEQQIGTIPAERRKLVTLHDAFGHYCERYGLECLGAVLGSHEEEPSAAEIAALTAKVKAAGVRTIFAEPQADASLLEAVGRDGGAAIGTLYGDALDERVASYVALMRFNTEQIVAGLK